MATSLSLGLLLTATTIPADAVTKWKRVHYGADMLKKVQKETAKMNEKQKVDYANKVMSAKVLSSPETLSFGVDTADGKLHVEYTKVNKRTNKTIKFKAY